MQLSYPEPECVLQVCESTPDNGMEKGCKSQAICTLSLPAEREGSVLSSFISLYYRCLSNPVDR